MTNKFYETEICNNLEEYAVSILFITGTFTTETMNVCLHEQNVYCIEAMKVQVRTHQVKT